MKQLTIAAILICALKCAAADASYTWDAENKTLLPDDGGVAILCEDETANVAVLTITPTDGGTVTIGGDPITFTADATLTLAASGSVSFASRVTTLGKLSLVRSDGAYIVWTGDALTESNKKTGNFSELPFADGSVTAADLEPTSVVYVATSATSSECRGRFDRYVDGPGSSIFVINRVEADHSYSIRPQISTGGLRCITAARSQRFGYYPSTGLWANTKVQGIDRGYWAAGTFANNGDRLGNVSTLGLTKIFAARKGATMAQVRFDGGVALSGETAVAAGMEAVVAVPEGDNVISGSFTGDGDVRIVPMAPTTAYAGTGYLEPWITKTSWQILATNRSLSALSALSGKMQGSSHSPGSTTGGDDCDAYWWPKDYADGMLTCQFQFKSSSNNKVVFARLRQNGLNVEIQAIKAGYVNVNTYPIGTDLTDVTLNDMNVATSATTRNYGIHMITATFGGESKMGIVTLDNSMNDMVGNQLTFEGGEQPLYVTVISKNAFPSYGDVNVGTNADVLLHVDALTVSGGISGGTSTLKVHRGGVLRRDDNGQISKPQQVIVDGGTLEHLGGGAISGGLYLNYLLLKDGARMTTPSGTAPRMAFDNTRSYYNVVGTKPSSIEGSGIRPYGSSTASTTRTFQINVNDVTGDEQVDCTLSKFDDAPPSYAYYNFEKWGDGTLKLEGDGKPVRLETRLYGGTFILGASNSMTNEVVLAGGSIATADGASNALGALTVSNACTIAVGEGGALSFASFTAGEELAAKAITIDAPLTGNVLRFGDSPSLTSDQRAMFRWKDGDELRLVRQDAEGYLRPILSGLAISIQ